FTHAASAGRRRDWTFLESAHGGVVNPPLWRASTIIYESVADLEAAGEFMDERLFYGRKGTPTTWALREALNGLEPGSAGTMLFPSGVAALATAILSVVKPGDHILITDSAYEPTTMMVEGLLAGLGIASDAYNPLAGGRIADALRPETSLIIMESPGSLTFEIQDVPAICRVARERGVATLLDNTWAASLLFQGIAAGCDMVMQSGTKYVGGHSDLMLGSVSAVSGRFETLRRTAWALGQCVSADDAALALRGFRTLPLRMERHGQSALEIARWLETHPMVARVRHPALSSDPGHHLWRRDFSGASGLFAFELHVGSRAQAGRFCDPMRHFRLGYSWGGYESLIIPVRPDRIRKFDRGPPAGMMFRVSIGLEAVADLIADLSDALERVSRLPPTGAAGA
ncbi:MAG: cystathionine beta-lyase, partial [Thermaurantiacus sp.]